MATGRLEGRRECTALLQMIILVFVTCWSRTVNGCSDDAPPLPSLPFVDTLPDLISPLLKGPSPPCFWQDSTALLKFRSQLSDPMGVLSSWNPLTDCCGWRGVACAVPAFSSERRVTGLQLILHRNQLSSLSLYPVFNNVAGVPLASLSSLETLSLKSITFHVDLPSAWGTLTSLRSLSLIDCAFTGNIPLSFERLQRLQHLDLSNNRLEGQFPFCMSEALKNLQTLNLSSNNFNGGILVMFRFSNLLVLNLSKNDFSDDPVPDLFGLVRGLRHLDLSHNLFKGNIPGSMEILGELRFLDLSHNEIRGSISPTLLALPNLTSARLQNNLLSGSIPAIYGVQSLLEVLDLSHNSISGIIPPEIIALRSIQTLNLSFNNLSSVIPDTLVVLSRLEFLFLQKNGLVGVIPPELARLSNLALANVSFNSLLGPIPGGPWPSFPASSYAGNVGLCGPPLLPCGLFQPPT